jgi:hypothetical protein
MNRAFSSAMGLAAVLAVAAARAQGAPAPASAWSYQIEGGALVAKSGAEARPVALPGTPEAVIAAGDRLYVALGRDGAAVLSLADPAAPALAQRVPVAQGRVTGFIVVDGAVWMKIDSTTAVLVEGGVPAGETAAAVTPLAAVPAAAAEVPATAVPAVRRPEAPIRILEVDRGTGLVKLAIGARDGAKSGDRFVVTRAVEIGKAGDTFEAKQTVADLEAEAVGEEVTLASLNRGDRVEVTDLARRAEQGYRPSRVFPRRLGGIGEASLVVRPLFNVGNEKGFGMLCDLTVAWWSRHMFFDVRMQPLGFGWTDAGDVLSTSILGEAGYDGRAFALGVGAGVGVINGDMGKALAGEGVFSFNDDEGNDLFEWSDRTRAAFALSQVVRLGARDGLNMTLYNLLLYYDPPGSDADASSDKSGFYYGGTSGRIGIPLASRVDLYLGGGGGLVGYWFSELGVFFWARGTGDAGSIGVSASGGAAGVWGRVKHDDGGGYIDTQRIDILGPMISLGLTGRFGAVR